MSHIAAKEIPEYQIALPFPHVVIDNFLDESFFQKVGDALFEEQFHEKYADLFHFFQTNDLQSSEKMQFFSEFIKNEFIPFMQELSGISLDSKIFDAQGSIYGEGNYLLCHDDRLDNRAIAFILYLTDLQPEEGGELLLYTTRDGMPTRANAKKIQPKTNRLVCFTVSDKSFHEVAEVLADTQRVAIGGWLHHERSK
jgi:Rps23 Pro-64 3,4-dihydroxylase Tpa1-like proline 4-hydroxylase